MRCAGFEFVFGADFSVQCEFDSPSADEELNVFNFFNRQVDGAAEWKCPASCSPSNQVDIVDDRIRKYCIGLERSWYISLLLVIINYDIHALQKRFVRICEQSTHIKNGGWMSIRDFKINLCMIQPIFKWLFLIFSTFFSQVQPN